MSEPTLQPTAETAKLPDIMPVLPLKDVVTYPFIILPLSVGREKSVRAVDQALAEHRVLMLLTQKSPLLDDPGEDDLPRFGTAASIMRMLKLPDGRLRILVQGVSRARVEHFSQSEPFLLAKVQPVEEHAADESTLEIQALVRSVKENLDHAVNLGKGISPEVMIIAANLDDPGRLADLAASNLDLEVAEAQRILETTSPFTRLQRVSELLLREVQLLTMQQEISMQARGEMDKSQREFFLRQQLKTIQEELGEGEELTDEIAGYRQRARERDLTEEALEELERQIRRLERGHPDSAESSVTRTYLDWLTGLPWSLRSEDNLDLEHARQVLDEDHYDLDKVKERIIEYLAVRKLNPESKGPILCFVGPPGVGKTSLGRSIARALGRKFVRLSLGGVRDEAEIRGHRRTYVGALPGQDPAGHPPGGQRQPGLHARRDRQDRRRLPRRSLVGAARGARPGAELDLPRPLPRRRLRPVAGDVHHHRQSARSDPAGLPRSHGGDPAVRLHRRREAEDRPPPPDPEAARRARARPAPAQVHRRRRAAHHRRLHQGGGPAESGARAGRRLPQGGGQGGRRRRQPAPR